jgi:hypothetical protein
MTKFALWQKFLVQNQTTAINVFVVAGVAMLFWSQFVRGKKWETVINGLWVALFWLALAGWALFSRSW